MPTVSVPAAAGATAADNHNLYTLLVAVRSGALPFGKVQLQADGGDLKIGDKVMTATDYDYDLLDGDSGKEENGMISNVWVRNDNAGAVDLHIRPNYT